MVISLLDLQSGAKLLNFDLGKDNDEEVYCMATCSKNNCLFVGSGIHPGGQLRIGIETRTLEKKYTNLGISEIICMAFSGSGKYLFISTGTSVKRCAINSF